MDVSVGQTAAEWNTYVSGHPEATVDHLWQWQEVIDGVFGHRCRYLIARRRDAIAGVLPLVLFRSRIFGRSVVSLPFLNYGGVLADDDVVAQSLLDRAREIAREFGAAYLELRHRTRVFPSLPARQHKLALSRGLPATSDQLWSDIDRKIRNQVRKAQKENLTVAQGGADLVPDFYRVFARNMRDLGTPVYSRRLFETTLRVFPDDARVFVVRQGMIPVAAGISIGFRDTVLVPWASSLREYRSLCPNMLLYWSMLEDAVARRAAVFDFGRSSPDSGTHAFKLQWGAQPSPMQWEYVLLSGEAIPDHGPASPTFQTAVKVWSRLPLSVANALGPLLVRSIP